MLQHQLQHAAIPTATRCNTDCNTLQHQLQHAATPIAARCNTDCNTLQHRLQHAATPTATQHQLQHAATPTATLTATLTAILSATQKGTRITSMDQKEWFGLLQHLGLLAHMSRYTTTHAQLTKAQVKPIFKMCAVTDSIQDHPEFVRNRVLRHMCDGFQRIAPRMCFMCHVNVNVTRVSKSGNKTHV
jgi:hypothetical protein